MHRSNPIIEDYKLLLVFRNVGLQLLQQLKAVMSSAPYSQYFKDITINEQNELHFSYLHYHFKTGIEVYFNHSKMPKSALLATYYWQPGAKAADEIVSYGFDLDYQVHDIYTLKDFAEPYLIEFHQNLKKTFSDNHIPLALRLK